MLLHAAVLALLLIQPRQERTTEPEPSYELVFSGGGTPDRSTSEQPGPEQPPSTPVPETTPEPPAPPEPVMPEAMALEPPPAPSTPEPPAPEPEAPQPAPLQPEPLQPMPPEPEPPEPAPASPDPVPAPEAPRARAAVRLTEPEPLAPNLTPQSLVPDLALTVPPMPPRVPPLPRQAQRRPAPASPFTTPMDLNFGQTASRVPPAPRGSVASRAVDLSPGAPRPGPNKSEAFFDARAAKVGADWANGLAAYWRRHRFYPRQAAENGEDGTVQVELVVNRHGKVESVEISRRSGSPWLDMAALSTWRNAQLAPFPAENTDPRITMTLTINYILLR